MTPQPQRSYAAAPLQRAGIRYQPERVREHEHDAPELSSGGPGLTFGGGRTGGPARENGPSALITRIVRAHREWNDDWLGEVARFQARDASPTVENMQSVQLDAARVGALSARAGDTGGPDDINEAIVIYMLDEAQTAAIVRFTPTTEPRVALASAHRMIDLQTFASHFEAGVAAEVREHCKKLLNDRARRAVPVPIVELPRPVLEHANSGAAAPVMRGDALTIDGRKQISVATCATRDGKRGIVTAEHGVRRAKSIVHADGAALPLEGIVRDKTWDAAWIPLPDSLTWTPQDGVPSPVRCKRYASAPGRGLRCSFHGAVSQYATAYVDGSDPLLPHFSKADVARVYTARVTKKGDSGALLVDARGRAIGMLRSQTKSDYVVPMSIWSYFPGVLSALRAEI